MRHSKITPKTALTDNNKPKRYLKFEKTHHHHSVLILIVIVINVVLTMWRKANLVIIWSTFGCSPVEGLTEGQCSSSDSFGEIER